jgi:hypothetical protein
MSPDHAVQAGQPWQTATAKSRNVTNAAMMRNFGRFVT